MKLPTLKKKKHSLRRKLFGYMTILGILLCALLLMGLFLIGSFTNTKQRIVDTLEFQSEIFERQIDTYYDSLAIMNVQLSQNATTVLENYLAEKEISFKNLNGSETYISELQDNLIDTLQRKLWEADCTGAFIMLNAQVNSNIENADVSRSGIYLQRNSLEAADTRVLLYRGLSQIGKEHDCMPHRKWRLEFSTDLFPNYEELQAEASFPLWSSYRITDVVLLPGTDQHIMLMTVPLLGDDGSFYGLCGFEINEGYFKQKFAQPSELDHAIFCLKKDSDGLNFPKQTLSAGVLQEYYLEPSGDFVEESFDNGLTEYTGEHSSYIGIKKEIELCPGTCTSAISVLIPKHDYNHMVSQDTLKIVLLIITFVSAATLLSWSFTKHYIKPLKQNIDQILKKEYEHNSAYTTEISDLFDFLAEQDRLNEDERTKAHQEKVDALETVKEIQHKYDEVTKNVERLAYSRKDEIDPDDYENFKNGLATLTKKEKEILQLYIQGKTVKDIISILQLQESTVRYHNKNIYAKLGVHSLKQLLRYMTVFNMDQNEK